MKNVSHVNCLVIVKDTDDVRGSMRIIEPSYSIEQISPSDLLEFLERCGRVCYKSEDKICDSSASKFINDRVNSESPHESVIEHAVITVRFVCDRGVTHEIVRHRLASFSQESTRYCNYAKGKFGEEITVIRPCFWEEGSDEYAEWKAACSAAEDYYFHLIRRGAKPQEARSVLPNSLKTEIVVTANVREWRHIFRMRTSKAAHPQMRQLMIPLLDELKQKVPIIFDKVNAPDEKDIIISNLRKEILELQQRIDKLSNLVHLG